jgi:hypothetical protein
MSGGGEGVYLGESLTEEKGSFGGRTRRLPKVVVEMEREGGEERKKERRGGRKGLAESLYPEGR